MAESFRYSDADLTEFKKIIVAKLAVAKEEYDYLAKQIKSQNE